MIDVGTSFYIKVYCVVYSLYRLVAYFKNTAPCWAWPEHVLLWVQTVSYQHGC